MAIPVVGDGEYLGAGNANETLNVGKGAQAVQVGGATATVTIGSGAASLAVGGSTSLVGFYGKTPVVRRTYAASIHNTTALASSTDFAAAQTAIVHELMNTMIGLGIYATA